MTYLEDIEIGREAVIGSHTFTADEIKTFAREYDPQPFHVDEAAAARSHFGKLCASGWHTAAMCMRFLVEHRRMLMAERAARGEPPVRWGPSPGFEDLKWIKPVYAGDTITYATQALETRVSKSRPGWGLVFGLNTGTNQDGALVYSFRSSVFVERRPSDGDR